MPDTPGKVISSLNATAERRVQSSKLGGCAGVFFQFLDRFNGKRLFPRKLLPAERPKRRSKQHKDEVKLPMAKLLLIADENRGGCLASKQPARPEEVPLQKDDKPNTKALNVVAKLMGLESMPFPESHLPARKRMEVTSHPSSLSRPHQAQMRKSRRKFTVDVKVSALKGKPIQLHRNRLDAYPARHASHRVQLGKGRSGKLVEKKHNASCHGALISPGSFHERDSKLALLGGRISSPLPSLQALKADPAMKSMLSPSRTPLKLAASPTRSPLSPSKSAARLFEAAVKLLEPGIQPRSPRTKAGAIQPQTASKVLAGGKLEKGSPFVPGRHLGNPTELFNRKNKHALQHHDISKQEKVVEVELGNRKRIASCKQQQVPDDDLLRTSVKSVCQPRKVGDGAQMRQNLCKQEVASHRVNHPDNMKKQVLRPSASKLIRYPSPPRSSECLLASEWSSQSSKSLPQALPQPSLSCVNKESNHSHLIPCKKSSVAFGKRSNRMDAGRRKEASSLVRSLLRKRVNTTGTQSPIDPHSEDGVDCDSSTNEVSVYGFEESEEKPLGEATGTDQSSCIVEGCAHKEANPNHPSEHDSRDGYLENAWCAEPMMVFMRDSMADLDTGGDSENYGHVLARLECVECPPSRLMLRGTKVLQQEGNSLMEECEPESESLCVEESGQPSPISILESPFQDAASSSSDGFENVQGRKLFEVTSSDFFGCTSSLRSQSEDEASFVYYTHALGREADDEACNRVTSDCTSTLSSHAEEAQLAECGSLMPYDKLMHSISSIHGADTVLVVGGPTKVFEREEDYVKEILRAAKVSAEDMLSRRMSLLGSLLDPAVFDKLEEQAEGRECGMFSTGGTLMEKGDIGEMCRLEPVLSFGAYERRKLLFDCIDEALGLNLINEKHSFVSYTYVHELLSPAHVFSQVYLQICKWDSMAVGLNWNDLVEKETSAGFGSWFHTGDEVELVVKDLESAVFNCLVEELVRELMSSKRWKVLKKKPGFRYKSPIKSGTLRSTLLSK